MYVARIPAVLAIIAALLAAPSVRTQVSGLVSVDLSDVTATIAQRRNLDESLMPLSIQVSADVAAAVCGVALDVMVQHANRGGEGCVAKQPTPELERAVADRMKTDEEPAKPARPRTD